MSGINWKSDMKLIAELVELLEEACDYAESATLEGDELPPFIEKSRKLIAAENA